MVGLPDAGDSYCKINEHIIRIILGSLYKQHQVLLPWLYNCDGLKTVRQSMNTTIMNKDKKKTEKKIDMIMSRFTGT